MARSRSALIVAGVATAALLGLVNPAAASLSSGISRTSVPGQVPATLERSVRPLDASVDNPTLDLGPPSAQSDVSTSSGPSPHGCYSQTDYPHKSGSSASVHGRTRCSNGAADYLTATTTLKRDRWYGEETLDSDTSSASWSTTSGDATPHWTCAGVGTYSYRGYTSSKSIEFGVTYVSSTRNWEIPGRSRFAC